ncbi:MAG: hypothetical protein ACI8V5_004334 [Limisphaerales bacterium]|jgi:hypothetical protein|tara:strand:+ start:96 stop:296 length:201 start_codon:yes stop_codon:yes gene_type:complete
MVKIVGCNETDCPADWESLPSSTGQEHDYRTCVVCLKSIVRCHSTEDLEMYRNAGQLAAIKENSAS